MLEQLVREQQNTNTLLAGIRHKVEYSAMLLLVALLLHFIGCPMMDGIRESRYRPPLYPITPTRTSPQ